MPKLLVTGGLGFIGSHFIRRIANGTNSYRVLNLDAEMLGINFKEPIIIQDSTLYKSIRVDIRDANALQQYVHQADIIVHFAAQTHVDRSISNPEVFVQTNVHGTFNLLEAARKTGVRKFVHISTDEVYGSAEIGKSFTETERLRPSSPYAASKAAAEMLVEAYHTTYGLQTIILRCTNNFGPCQFPEKFIPKTIITALQGRRIPIYGNGKQIRDWIYVTDFCAAVEAAILRAPAGAVYNVSAGNEMQNVEVAKLVLQKLGKPLSLLQFVEDRPGHDLRYSLDSNRIRSELDWKPAHSFTDAIGETVDWYVKNESWWRPLINDKVLSPTPWKENW